MWKFYEQHLPILCGLLAQVFIVDSEWKEVLKKESDFEVIRSMSAPPSAVSMTKWILHDPRPRLTMMKLVRKITFEFVFIVLSLD